MNHQNSESTPANNGPNFFLLLFIALIFPAVLGIGLVYSLYPDPEMPTDLVERAKVFLKEGDGIQANRILRQNQADNIYNIEYNRVFLFSHFRLPEYANNRKVRDDEQVKNQYEMMCMSPLKTLSDHGCYYLGLFYSHQDNYNQALQYFNRVTDLNQEYLNFSKGMAYAHQGKHKEALDFFYKELELGTNNSDTIFALSMSLATLNEWEKLQELTNNSDYINFIPTPALQKFRLASGQYGTYLREFTSLSYSTSDKYTFFFSVLGLLTWALLIRWWIPSSSFHWSLFSLVTLTGAVVSQLVIIFHDFVSLFFNFGFRGSILNDLFYSIFFIGFIEEIVKFIPVLILYLFNKLEKPSDWMVYAAASALGFGILESFNYVSNLGYSIAVGRFFVSVPMHILLSSMLGIAMGEAKHRGTNRMIVFLVALSGVSIVHGLFDFALLGPIKFLSLFAFYGTMFVAIIFMRGRTGILYLSNSTLESEPERLQSYTIFPFIGFGLMVFTGVLLTANNIDKQSLLFTIGIRTFFSIGAFYVLFFLSIRPLANEWIHNWYKPPSETKDAHKTE